MEPRMFFDCFRKQTKKSHKRQGKVIYHLITLVITCDMFHGRYDSLVTTELLSNHIEYESNISISLFNTLNQHEKE